MEGPGSNLEGNITTQMANYGRAWKQLRVCIEILTVPTMVGPGSNSKSVYRTTHRSNYGRPRKQLECI